MTMPERYAEIFSKEQSIVAYLDLANMLHWQETLGWTFLIEDVIRCPLMLPNVKEVKVYFGENPREVGRSKALHARIRKAGGILRTKQVKFIRKTINGALLFKQSTMSLFDGDMHEKIVALVEEIEQRGFRIEEPKCNFDVEMAMDMMDDLDKMSAALLFSGDSDLAAPLERLKLKGKRVFVAGVRGQTARELHQIKDAYFDFGQLYTGSKRYGQNAKIPPFGGTA